MVPEVTTTALSFRSGKSLIGPPFFHQQTGADHEDGIGEGRLFLALKVVGG